MNQPLCEIFGHPYNNFSHEAVEDRLQAICPYNNKYSRCTKDKAKHPLGVCSTFENGSPIIICPIRFRQDWRILSDISNFLLPGVLDYKYVSEVRMKDGEGQEVGNIDAVLVNYENNQVVDFGALEIQAVYISGNIRNPFENYMINATNPKSEFQIAANSPRPDWLSSIKRLVRQITVKGAILQEWQKKMAIVVQKQFFTNMPALKNITTVSPTKADLCWYLYDLSLDESRNEYNLVLIEQVYVKFSDALERFSKLQAGDIQQFIDTLEKKIKEEQSRNGSTTISNK